MLRSVLWSCKYPQAFLLSKAGLDTGNFLNNLLKGSGLWTCQRRRQWSLLGWWCYGPWAGALLAGERCTLEMGLSCRIWDRIQLTSPEFGVECEQIRALPSSDWQQIKWVLWAFPLHHKERQQQQSWERRERSDIICRNVFPFSAWRTVLISSCISGKHETWYWIECASCL